MLIVSQDKNELVNFDNIAHIFIEEGSGTTISYGKMSGCSETLGYYKTEERAKEVLKEIWEFYEMSKRYECSSNISMTIFLEPKFAYQMPER